MTYPIFFLTTTSFLLSGCLSADHVNNEYQTRMQRCEQYVGITHEKCLNGEVITIEEFKEDYREFQAQQKPVDQREQVIEQELQDKEEEDPPM